MKMFGNPPDYGVCVWIQDDENVAHDKIKKITFQTASLLNNFCNTNVISFYS